VRIFTASLVTETNTYSPIPTGWAAFERNRLQHGRSGRIQPFPDFASMIGWRERGEAEGHTVIESIAATAEPAGRTVRAVYEALRDEMLEDLRNAAPVDVVLLFLHGAMVAEGYDDVEGDLLARCREVAGDRAIVGAELDLHAHLTQTMLVNADCIIAYKEYPHVDIVERSRELYRICVDAATDGTRPRCAAYDCETIGMYPTTREPLRSFVDDMAARERDGILSLSLIHGFRWADVPERGTKMLAVANDAALGANTAREFGERFRTIRDAALLVPQPLDTVIARVAADTKGTLVIADVTDNAGGGAPGDSTFVLRALLEHGIADVATGTYYDPIAVELCFEAGVGARLDLRFGGKLGPASGDPIDGSVTVRGLRDAHAQDSMDDSGPVPLGRSAWITIDGIDVVLVSLRSQVFAPNAFTDLGIALHDKRAIVVKSSHHFYGKFAPLAAEVLYTNAPGALVMDFERGHFS
jgi:microcystin degradation protein MlrC